MLVLGTEEKTTSRLLSPSKQKKRKENDIFPPIIPFIVNKKALYRSPSVTN
jgi:hypothetical protein